MSQSMAGLSEKIWQARGIACGISLLPLACSIAFAVVYGGMAAAMTKYDEDAITAAIGDAPPREYDLCGAAASNAAISLGQLQQDGTNWGLILEFNMILYSVISGCIGLMLLGTFFCPFYCCGMLGATCASGLGQIAAIVITGIFRLSKEGKQCA